MIKPESIVRNNKIKIGEMFKEWTQLWHRIVLDWVRRKSCDKKTLEEPVLLTSPPMWSQSSAFIMQSAQSVWTWLLHKQRLMLLPSQVNVTFVTNYVLNSSLQLPNCMDLNNMRGVHSYFTSGLIPSQIERFSYCLAAVTRTKYKCLWTFTVR